MASTPSPRKESGRGGCCSIGGAAASAAVRAVAPSILGVPVHVPPPGEYVAEGAARQAAWVVLGGEAPPSWPLEGTVLVESEPQPQVREAYAAARLAAYPGTRR